MTKVDENIKSAQNLLNGIVESCYDLERENQKLKDEVKDLVERNIELDKKYMLVLTKNKKLEEEKQELEYLGDINEEFKEENKKLKYVIDSVMEKAGIEYIRLADGDVFTNPKNKLQISDTIQVDILNHKQ